MLSSGALIGVKQTGPHGKTHRCGPMDPAASESRCAAVADPAVSDRQKRPQADSQRHPAERPVAIHPSADGPVAAGSTLLLNVCSRLEMGRRHGSSGRGAPSTFRTPKFTAKTPKE